MGPNIQDGKREKRTEIPEWLILWGLKTVGKRAS